MRIRYQTRADYGEIPEVSLRFLPDGEPFSYRPLTPILEQIVYEHGGQMQMKLICLFEPLRLQALQYETETETETNETEEQK